MNNTFKSTASDNKKSPKLKNKAALKEQIQKGDYAGKFRFRSFSAGFSRDLSSDNIKGLEIPAFLLVCWTVYCFSLIPGITPGKYIIYTSALFFSLFWIKQYLRRPVCYSRSWNLSIEPEETETEEKKTETEHEPALSDTPEIIAVYDSVDRKTLTSFFQQDTGKSEMNLSVNRVYCSFSNLLENNILCINSLAEHRKITVHAIIENNVHALLDPSMFGKALYRILSDRIITAPEKRTLYVIMTRCGYRIMLKILNTLDFTSHGPDNPGYISGIKKNIPGILYDENDASFSFCREILMLHEGNIRLEKLNSCQSVLTLTMTALPPESCKTGFRRHFIFKPETAEGCFNNGTNSVEPLNNALTNSFPVSHINTKRSDSETFLHIKTAERFRQKYETLRRKLESKKLLYQLPTRIDRTAQ